MNYLAHCYFADDSAESLIGNLAPDFLRARGIKEKIERYTPANAVIRAGMERHRWIDIFTDEHVCFRRSCERLGGRFPHLSPIIVDIAYDHFLARSWNEFHAQPLGDFVRSVYARLNENAVLCPQLLQMALPRMIEQNWLESYLTPEGIEMALARLSRRIGRAGCFDGAVVAVMKDAAGFDADFRAIFSELKSALTERECHT